MTISTVAILLALFAVIPQEAVAECVNLTLKVHKNQADFIFEGTVKQVVPADGNELAAEIQPHQVWKGKIPTTTSVHFVADLDGPNFKPGERYIIFGVRETDRRRKVFELAGDAHKGMIWVNPCAGTSISSPEMVKQLGRSKKPT